MTDLDHIAGLSRRQPPKATDSDGLLAFLNSPSRARGRPGERCNARQIESEAEAVQIMTIFVAKGLEFPVVCVPTMWRQGHALAHEVVYQDPITHERTFDIANGPGWPQTPRSKARKALADAEALGENLRLLYVAVTRSKHQTLLWWWRARNSEITGLARVLFARAGGEIDPERFWRPRCPCLRTAPPRACSGRPSRRQAMRWRWP